AVVETGGIAADLAQEAGFVVRELGQAFGTVAVIRVREKLRKGQLHGSGNFRKCIERRDGVSVFDARQIAAKQAGALFEVALRHSFLEPVVSDRLADIHGREHFRMGHGNHSSNFWQGEICANPWNVRAMWKTNRTEQYALRRCSFFARCKRNRSTKKRLTVRVL